MFVVSGFEWFTTSRSVAVESYLTRFVNGYVRNSEERERERNRVGEEHLPPRVRHNYAYTCLYMIDPKPLNRKCW